MAINTITDAERKNVCISGLADVPGLSTTDMQKRFDGLGNLAINKVNELVEAFNELSIKCNQMETKIEELSALVVNETTA